MAEQKQSQDDSPDKQSVSQLSPPAEELTERPVSPEEVREELDEAIEGSEDVLAVATTVSPFFPDIITVDRAKLTIAQRRFVATGEVMSIRVEDILNATATVGPMFGTVKIVSRVLSGEKPYVTKRLWRTDAIHLKRIIQGYVIALQRKIDCSKLPTGELVAKLDRLGEDEHRDVGVPTL